MVRYAVLADIHGNLEALEAVRADMAHTGAERVLCLGDIVGYGANPRECLEIVRELDTTIVAGNHDWAAAGNVGVDYFNADARDSVEWTRHQLSAADLEFLRGLELQEVLDAVTLVHGSPFSPEYFEYLQTSYDVQVAFDHLDTRLCFVGHSHVPVIFTDTEPLDYFLRDEFEFLPDTKVIVNAGSVGQPRDLDPRACYAVYDDEEDKIYLRRVEYDMQKASQRMLAAGLPATNAARIVLGR
jgi:diadenosine tetraphosphatase ApaH/serine/threonine PP2A family protein phosphatase